jgi:alkanesulfonate monooxygenase SsuD/methylene tetrahydromethanopterin reductase-like flavin-dependent oxidoreductase (luciferase family)
MLDLWRKADGWGYDSLWNFDHFYPIFTDPEGPCFEGWTTPAEARGQIMIGGRQECLDTVERYARAGVTHFIFMTFTPYMVDEIRPSPRR